MSAASSLSISPDGRFALSISADSRLSLYSTNDAKIPPQTFSERAHLSVKYTTSACWCPNNPGRLVAVGTGDGSVVVWDVSRGEIASRLGGPLDAGEGGSEVKGGKRRQRESIVSGFTGAVQGLWWRSGVEEEEEGMPPLYACAAGSGQIHGWRLRKDGKVFQIQGGGLTAAAPGVVLRGGEKSGISRVAFASGGGEDGVLFAAGTGQVRVLCASGTGKLASLAGLALPTTGLCVSDDGTILVASTEERTLHLWDLRCLPELVSNSSTGTAEEAPIQPTAILLHPGNPVPSELSVVRASRPGKSSKKAVYHVCSTGSGGNSVIWRYRRRLQEKGFEGEEGAAPIRPGCVVRVDRAAWARGLPASSSGAKPLHSEKPGVLACRLISGEAAFTSGGELARVSAAAGGAPVLVAAVGPFANPTFFVTAYTQATMGAGEEEEERVGDSNRVSTHLKESIVLAPSEAAPSAGKTSGSKIKETIVEAKGSVSARSSMQAGAEAEQGLKRRRVEEGEAKEEEIDGGSGGEGKGQDDNDGEDDLGGAESSTLGKHIRSLISKIASSDPRGTTSDPQVDDLSPPFPFSKALPQETLSSASTGSLAVILVQALTADDDVSLESVLAAGLGSRGNASRIVTVTVQRLPVAHLLPFLTKLVTRMAARPSRGIHLLPWIKACISVHAGYLISLPNLVPTLESLYTMIDNRLSVQKKLLRLSGRLDLLLGQIHHGVVSTGAVDGDEAAASGRSIRSVNRKGVSSVFHEDIEASYGKEEKINDEKVMSEVEDDEDDEDEDEDEGEGGEEEGGEDEVEEEEEDEPLDEDDEE